MKDCQKRWKPNNTDSVIAALMGFDELRPQQPSPEKCRVLSDTYVRKAASVGARPGSLISVRRRNKEIVHGAKGASGEISKFKNDNDLDINSGDTKVKTGIRSPKPAGISVSDSLSGASYDDRRSFGKRIEHRALGNVLGYRQKLEPDLIGDQLGELGIDYTNKSFKFPPEIIDKPRLFPTSTGAFKQELEKVPYNLADVKLDRRSRSGYREQRELRHESQKHHHELTYKELSVNSIVSPGRSCIPCTRAKNRNPLQERHRSKFEDVLVLSCPGENDYKNYGNDQHLSLGQSYLPNELKRQNFERWKTAKSVQAIGISRGGGTLNELLALADKKLMQRNLNLRLGRNGLHSLSSLQSTNSSSSSPSGFSSVDVWEDDCIKSLPVFEFEAIKQILSRGCNLKQDESTVGDNKLEQKVCKKDVLEPKGGSSHKQFKTSSDVNATMLPSSELSEQSNCCFSRFTSENSNPEAYIQGFQDEMNNCSENDTHREIEISQRVSRLLISNVAAPYTNDDAYASVEALVCSRTYGDTQSESNPGILSGEGGHSCYVEEVSSREPSLNEFSEEESSYSNSSRIVPPEFRDNRKKTNQHSPNSVLEPFSAQYSSAFQFLDGIDLQLQLEALNFETEETYSGESVMAVSDDDVSEECFGDVFHDAKTVKRWLGDDESRNFSYLVDVLDEAGFCGMKSLDLETWHSLECPISPLVFVALEKKYDKQTSWQKTERRLLFDRINSGLMGIFNPVVNFHPCAASIKRNLCSSLRRDDVEDELWKMLISQEKETSKSLSNKALEKWFELEEGTTIICTELEKSLFDELVLELASFWD
ncbi:uncharacterized protein LOC105178567 [Sesamum indicum]|uniref:Uncharacterized protein LOC105178567 n=1 Tax=Sesamum indicum TaxID=4182 RepID=A0A6I9UYX0_SESIN|nr:uncharacterized protein LOC105178567 [Sesamum indicum]